MGPAQGPWVHHKQHQIHHDQPRPQAEVPLRHDHHEVGIDFELIMTRIIMIIIKRTLTSDFGFIMNTITLVFR